MMKVIHSLRIFLLPFSLLYWILISIRNLLYTSTSLKKIFKMESYKSEVPVICVGNIRVGGTGKSQIVLNLAQELIKRNQKIAILSRGYKRKSKGFFEVNSLDVEKFGDEPVFLKMNLENARVFVSEDRKLAIQNINRTYQFDFILMDDGLQNLSVHKDFSIVVLDNNFYSKNIFEKLLLPAGNLREPKSKIFDYDCLILNKKFDEDELENPSHKNFFEARYKLEKFIGLDGQEIEISELQKQNSGAFCGIAQPLTFEKLLRKNSIFLRFFKVFPDHYSYQIQDLKLLLKFVEKFGSKYLITTEKDIVRLIKFKNEFERAEVFLVFAKITAEIKNEEKLIQDILCQKRK